MYTNLKALDDDPVLKFVRKVGKQKTAEHFKWPLKDVEEYILEQSCRNNPEFFDKHCLMIQTKAGELIPFIDNPVQRMIQSAIDRQTLEGKPIRLKIPKARRHGVSTKIQSAFFGDALYGQNLQMLTVCHDLDAARNMREIFQRFYDHFRRVKPKFSPVRGSDKWWKNAKKDVSYMIDTAEEVETGRSFTFHRLHLSEVAWYRDPQTLMTGLLRSVDRNPNTMIVAESTANGMGGWWYDFVMNNNEYELLFFPWFEDAGNAIPCNDEDKERIVSSMIEHEKWLMNDCHCTLDQLNWRRHEIKNGFNDDEDLFRQEYPSSLDESFITSGRPFFLPVSLIRSEFHRTSSLPRKTGYLEWAEENKSVRFIEGRGPWLIMSEPDPQFKNKYVTGSDPAEGIAADSNNKDPDYSVCTVWDRQTRREAARFCARHETDVFAEEIHKASVWYGSACDCVERNSPGIAVLNILKATQVNLFRKELMAKAEDGEREEYGFRTDTNTRDTLLSELRSVIRDKKYLSNDNVFWNEITQFVYDEKGKPQAQSGSHDDCVISAALTQQALSQAGPVEKIREEEVKRIYPGDADIRHTAETLQYAEF